MPRGGSDQRGSNLPRPPDSGFSNTSEPTAGDPSNCAKLPPPALRSRWLKVALGDLDAIGIRVEDLAIYARQREAWAGLCKKIVATDIEVNRGAAEVRRARRSMRWAVAARALDGVPLGPEDSLFF